MPEPIPPPIYGPEFDPIELAATVNTLRNMGFPHAERRGSGFDASDIIGIPGMTIEIKNQATMNLAGWIDQLLTEMEADNSDSGVVIHKRRGCRDPQDWYATLPMWVWADLAREAGYGNTTP